MRPIRSLQSVYKQCGIIPNDNKVGNREKFPLQLQRRGGIAQQGAADDGDGRVALRHEVVVELAQ